MPSWKSVEKDVDELVHFILEDKEEVEIMSPSLGYDPKISLQCHERRKLRFSRYFSSIPEEDMPAALDHYMKVIYHHEGHESMFYLIKCFEGCREKLFLHRGLLIYDTFSKIEYLETHEKFWHFAFKIIGILVSEADYKLAQIIFEMIMKVVSEIQRNFDISNRKDMQQLQQILEKYLNKKEDVYCSYLVLNDICRRLPAGKSEDPDWAFWNLISHFIQSFRPAAQMVSISIFKRTKGETTEYGNLSLLPIIGHRIIGQFPLLDIATGKMSLQGFLPYNMELLETKAILLKFALSQQYSRWALFNLFSTTQKSVLSSRLLEEQFAGLIIVAMEKLEFESLNFYSPVHCSWQHLSTEMLFLTQFEDFNFFNVITNLFDMLQCNSHLRKGRDHLMWLLLQFVSATWNERKYTVDQYSTVIEIYNWLYHVDDVTMLNVEGEKRVYALGMAFIWKHLEHKANVEKVELNQEFPNALNVHYNYLKLVHPRYEENALVSYGSNQHMLSILGNTPGLENEQLAENLALILNYSSMKNWKEPLSMSMLDSCTHHFRLLLFKKLTEELMKFADSKCPCSFSYSLAVTYSRLLVYYEIETIGRNYFSRALQLAFHTKALQQLHVLLEIISYRLHHISSSFRTQIMLVLLKCFHQEQRTQLFVCLESTLLRLITGIEILEIKQLYYKLQSESENLFSRDSVEFNKVIILNIVTAISMTGYEYISEVWWQELVTSIMQHTPFSWSSYTLRCFPNVPARIFESRPLRQNIPENALMAIVNRQYGYWRNLNYGERVTYSILPPGVFLCLIWKMLEENVDVPKVAYEVLFAIGAPGLSKQIRAFIDFIVFGYSPSRRVIEECITFENENNEELSEERERIFRIIDILNDMIWKYKVLQLDRLLLYMAFHSYEGDNETKSFIIMHTLLLKSRAFQKRLTAFLDQSHPVHWVNSSAYIKRNLFVKDYPEGFFDADLIEAKNLTSHFGDVCLRLLPVLDILIHRFIEFSPITLSCRSLFEIYGCLYKFHCQPLTYIYRTLYTYENVLRSIPEFRKGFVLAVIGSFSDIREKGWALTDAFIKFCNPDMKVETTWIPDLAYYKTLVERFSKTISGNNQFYKTDWRFNEFPSEKVHALHATCVEIMALPLATMLIVNGLCDVVLRKQYLPVQDFISIVNAIALILHALPEAFMEAFSECVFQIINSPSLAEYDAIMDPFEMFDFTECYNSTKEHPCTLMIVLSQSVWFHANSGQLRKLILMMKENILPAIKTEEQFLYTCHLVGPFFQRMFQEMDMLGMGLILALYSALLTVDRYCVQLNHIDEIGDLLNHIKSDYLGRNLEDQLRCIIPHYKPDLQKKLKFICT